MTSLIPQLHCGACQTPFDDLKELDKHLSECSAAKYLLPVAIMLSFTNDDSTHKVSNLFQLTIKHANLIHRYATSVAYEMSNLERSNIHMELCEKLGLDYKTFKPFEADDIIELPSVEGCKEIIWKALREEMRKRLAK